MNIEATWKKLMKIGIVEGVMPKPPWKFKGRRLAYAKLAGSDLQKAKIKGANLFGANLSGSNLRGIRLIGANLSYANLSGTDLSKANLRGANLFKANLQNANLFGANLKRSSLVGTNIAGANLIGCKVYGISSWDIKRDDSTTTKDLIISSSEDSFMTVDDIEVAQFIYLLINNEKIKSMIDTMRTKTVLILGSFDRHSLIVLDALKDAIREHDRLPVLINFDKPEKHELMETVKTMALLSSFIIVDLSIRSGQLHELSRLVPDTYIPFVTIAAKGTKLTAMQNEFKHHYWYKSKYFQYSKECRNEEIPELFETKILPWAEKINEKLRKKRMS